MGFAKKKIYLAGPITGQTYNNARYGWRHDFSQLLRRREADHLECYSPMREKEFLEKNQCIGGEADYESLHGFGTPQGILTRDHNDVRNCDAMVACFLGAERVSIGTCVEFGFAHAYRKPVIMVMEHRVTRYEAAEAKTEYVPGNIVDRGDDAIGRYLTEMGHDIAGGRLIQQQADQGADGYIVTFVGARTSKVEKNPHDHVFLRACAGYVVPTLEAAADIAYSLLTPGL